MIQLKTNRKLVFVVVALTLVVAAIGKAWANPGPTISIAPSKVDDLSTSQSFTVDVVIAGVSDLYGWQFNVTFNSNILNASKVSEGPFLMSFNDTAWPKPVIDNTRGYILASALLMPPYPALGASGTGTLANITFTVKSGGSSSLHFDETKTYLRSVSAGVIVPIEGLVRQDGTYGSGGAGISGVPLELIAGVAVVVVVVVVAGVLLWRRRRA